jgi:hypothetical protein
MDSPGQRPGFDATRFTALKGRNKILRLAGIGMTLKWIAERLKMGTWPHMINWFSQSKG